MLSSGGGLAYSVQDEFVEEEDESVSLQFVCALQSERIEKWNIIVTKLAQMNRLPRAGKRSDTCQIRQHQFN